MPQTQASSPGGVLVRRFGRFHRALHLVMMVSFLGLAYTGLPLLFSDAEWAAVLARLLGGFHAAGILHRVFATTLVGIFTVHVTGLLHRVFVGKELDVLWGPNSLVPQPRDVLAMIQHIRWFLRLGPRPVFDRYTYWEKFDYWAVFWGMAVIGTSGLVMWFPHLFSRFVPGWFFNVALLVHKEEALLAVGFIFTIHFFNSHLRPEKFPMDMVIFTGHVTLEELREERPAEYERLRHQGRLQSLIVEPEPRWMRTAGRVVGAVAVTLGLVLVVLIVSAVLF